MTNYHLMLDLEALATSGAPAIVSVGAQVFDNNCEWRHIIGGSIHVRIQPDEWTRHGPDVDGRTIAWWMQQPLPVRQSACLGSDTLATGIAELDGLIQRWTRNNGPEAGTLWARGEDWAWIRAVADRVRYPLTFDYSKVRDVRTLTALAGVKRPDVDHDALLDAQKQIDDLRGSLMALDLLHRGIR